MSNLRELIRGSFSEEEVKNLSFDLAVDYEDLPALGKTGKVRELIIYCQKNGRLSALITACQEQRPNETWPDLAQAIPSLEELLGEPVKPRLPFEPEMVEVSAGVFLMGAIPGANVPAWETPQHEVNLSAFQISKYPITNHQFAEFLTKERQITEPNKEDWFNRKPLPEKRNFPVTTVSWNDAQAYCSWLSAATGKKYRLPTEAEWEKAARGTDGRIYPWGNEWQDGRCNAGDGKTAVTAYDDHLSPFGCADMIGNVQEWTSTLWGEDRKQCSYLYPYQLHDGREDPENDPQRPRLRRVHRGGAFNDEPVQFRCPSRDHARPDAASNLRGFRVVLTE